MRVFRSRLVLSLAACLLGTGILSASAADGGKQTQLKQALQTYLAEHGEAEGITGLSAAVTAGAGARKILAVAGRTHRKAESARLTPSTLFEIGSNTKAFTAALLLQLEAKGLVDLDQTVGDWLPQYPAWRKVTIRALLNMTSGIPTYSEAPKFMKMQASDPNHHFTPEELVDFAYPRPGNQLPVNRGYFYSNTNYVLAGMIIEKAGKASYTRQLKERILEPLGMNETYYDSWKLPKSVLDRMAGGYFENPECSEYQPTCKTPPLQPLLGRNMQRADLSWTGAAGGIVSTPRDLQKWVRALFGGKVLPRRQLRDMMELVSTRTGKPIMRTGTSNPDGFALGIAQKFMPGIGRFWFYEGITLGYRAAYGWFPDDDVVVAVFANSQPAVDNIGPLMTKIRSIFVDE